ncbi:MAG: reverse transcriptase domain-containing protein [Nitrospirota bacterium]
MPNDLNDAFELNNLRRAWKWTLTNTDSLYKNYFRHIYEVYSVPDDNLLYYLKDRLKRGIFEPTDACKVYLPKKSGILRPYTLLCIEDQIVYQALANIIAEKLYPRVHKRYYKETFGHLYAGKRSQYFYRKWQTGHKKFGEAIRDACSKGFVYRAFFDLTACYDSIDHNVLKHFLEELEIDMEFISFLLKCLRHWTKADTERQIYQGHGIPQGPLPSGLIAEVVLSHFDNKRTAIRKIKYFRYVDDIRMYAKDEHHLRHMLVELDLLSKSIGLFPQSSKIDIRRITDVNAEIKSISNPPEPTHRRYGLQKQIHKRLKELTSRYKISDETRFKYVLAHANPSLETSRRLLRIIRNYPHLYVAILRYFNRYESLPLELCRQLYMILKDDNLYPSFSSDIIRAICGKVPNRMIPPFNNHIKKLFNETDKIGRSDLKAACCMWLLQNRVLNYQEIERFFSNNPNWWVMAASLSNVKKDFIGNPSYGALLNQLTKHKSTDISILAAYLLASNALELERPRSSLNKAAELMLKEFRVIARTKAVTCGIETALNSMLKVPISAIDWRTILGGRYTEAERKIIRAKGYFKTDPSAWVNVIDTFNDFLLDALFEHDSAIGNYQWGNIGGVLSPTSAFANKYPKIYKAVNELHSKRLESDLSHTKVKKTGKPTRPIKFSYIPKACKLIYDAFIELRDNW